MGWRIWRGEGNDVFSSADFLDCYLFVINLWSKSYNYMEISLKKQTAFRLDSDLLDRLKSAARREHRSLNNYVECLLRDIMYNEPNETTKAAIEEARTVKNKEAFDSVEDLMEELMK